MWRLSPPPPARHSLRFRGGHNFVLAFQSRVVLLSWLVGWVAVVAAVAGGWGVARSSWVVYTISAPW